MTTVSLNCIVCVTEGDTGPLLVLVAVTVTIVVPAAVPVDGAMLEGRLE